MNNGLRLVLLTAISLGVNSQAAAWDEGGTGGETVITGEILPLTENIWEILVNPSIDMGQEFRGSGVTTLTLPVKTAIPLLGIRLVEAHKTFLGAKIGAGIVPQINFKGAINTSNFSNSITTMTLQVKDADTDAALGTLSFPFSAAAEVLYYPQSPPTSISVRPLISSSSTSAFYGGLPLSGTSSSVLDALQIAGEFKAGHADNYSRKGTAPTTPSQDQFDTNGYMFSAFYTSGIRANSNMTLTLKSPMGKTPIKWKASMPVTITYL